MLLVFAQRIAFRFCATARRTDCHVASLLAMTVGEVPSRPTSVHPQTRARLQHVIVNNVLATADTWQISACHCEPVRTLVWQSASPQGNGASWLLFRQIRYAFRIRPKYCFSVLYYRKENGLPRRFAPRNDRQKHVAVRVGNYAFRGEIRHAFRIRPKDCFSVLCYRKENGLPLRSSQ